MRSERKQAAEVASDMIFSLLWQAYVNMALFENFTYAGIDATAEEA